MQDLENLVIERHKLPFKLLIYYRYVNDIILAVPNYVLDMVLQTFNSVYKRLQFIIYLYYIYNLYIFIIYNIDRKRKQD